MAETDPSTHGLQFPDWQPQFHAALLETDPKQLTQRVMTAEEAVFVRQQTLAESPTGDVERKAMVDAIRQLLVIQVEKLNYLAWK
jgi:hypothetical protein